MAEKNVVSRKYLIWLSTLSIGLLGGLFTAYKLITEGHAFSIRYETV